MDTSWMTLLTSAGGGGIFGVLAKGLSAFINYKQTRQNHNHELELRKLDLQEARIEAEGIRFTADKEAETDQVMAAYESTESAREHDVQRWSTDKSNNSLIRLDVLRGSVRPVIIYYLSVLATTMWFTEPTHDIRGILVHATVAWLSGALAFYYGGRDYVQPKVPSRLQSFADKFPNGIPMMGKLKK